MPQYDWRPLYPFESNFFDADGARMHYVDQGPRDAPQTLVMVHGNPTWSFYWRELIKTFGDRHRVIAPDHIGCGLSDKPQQYRYTLAQHVANLTALIKHLDLQHITLVGHDWGGAIGLGAAENVSERVDSLALLNTAGFRASRIPLRIRVCRTPMLGPLAVRGLNAFSRAALRMATAKPDKLAPEIKAGYLAPYDSWRNRVAVQRFVEDIPIRSSHPSYQTLRQIEEGLPMFRGRPIALIWGMRDWCFTPWFLERFGDVFPEAKVHAVDDAGHWVVEDATERVISAITDLMAAPTPNAASPPAPAAGTA